MRLHAKQTLDSAYPLSRRHGDAGLDVRTPQDLFIRKDETYRVDCGWAFEPPKGWHLFCYPRSSQSGLYAIEAPVIDGSYRGSIHCVIHNISGHDRTILKGTKVMQLVMQPAPDYELIVVTGQLTMTERGNGAFGSTGQ